MFYPAAFLSGFGTSIGLIAAIGAQNAFVLKQGILRNHLFLVAFLCVLFDALLMSVGVAGFGVFITSSTILMSIAKWTGVIFLSFYAAKSFKNAFSKNGVITLDSSAKPISLKKTIGILLAITFLNPHVYIDTCLLIGTIGSNFPGEQRITFTIGAIVASFIWFFSLTYLGKALAPLFEKRISWQILETFTGLLMLSLAIMLVFSI